MLTNLINSAIFSTVGETVAICRFEDEIIVFANGKPIPYRMFMPIFMNRISRNPEFPNWQKLEVGVETARMLKKMSDLGVGDYLALVDQSLQSLFFLFEYVIDNVIQKAKERSKTPEDALRHLIEQIEEQYEAALHS